MVLGIRRSITANLLLFAAIFYFIQQATLVYAAELSKAETEYLKKKSTITFISQTNYPPFEFLGLDGDHTGMCIDLVRWISTEFGFKVHFTDTSFKQAQDEILSGKADIITSLFYSKKRNEVFDFSEVLFEVPASIFVLAERPDIKEINNLQGKVIAIPAGDYAQEFLTAKNITCTFKYTKNFAEATDLVIAGKADAIIGDEQIVLYHIFSNDLTKQIKKIGDPLYIGKNCMGAKDPNPILVGIMNKGIKSAQKNGVFDQIYKKWMGRQYFPQSSWTKQYLIYFFILMGGIFLAAILGWVWNIKLRQMVFARTMELSNSEKSLHREKETLSMILESTPHGISVIDNNDKYLYVNPYYTKITGYTLEDIPSKKKWFEKAYPDKNYRKKIIETWNKDILHGGLGETREFKIKCKNGDAKHIEFRSSFLKDKKISVLTDVTSRKESEEMVREKDRLQGVLELSGAVCHEMNQPLMSTLGYFDLILMDMSVDDPNYSRIDKIQTQLERMSNITKKLMEISRYQTKDYLNGKILDLSGTSKVEMPGHKKMDRVK
ncbi:MAG: transporter substrate-binding domain-containing protein [Desulfobacteraceae bacterium]|nr:transporter substrate-binding domain-containing protein [Desulfobacteraceae bacterium]